MDIDDYTLGLYEKLYFHEIDLREKLLGRLQITLSVAVPILGAIGYLLLNFKFENFAWDKPSLVFLVLLACSIYCSFRAMFYFCRTLYEYKLAHIPFASKIEDDVTAYVSSDVFNHEEKRQEVSGYFKRKFVDATTKNSVAYEIRAKRLKYTNYSLIAALFFLVLSFGVFSYYGLDKTPEVNISKPVTLSGDKSPNAKAEYLLIFLQSPVTKNESMACQITQKPKNQPKSRLKKRPRPCQHDKKQKEKEYERQKVGLD